ncbi:MAG TPA: hypothetical protein VMR62_01480 [Bryobacteraceae bacterium]|nr:hypothetical protein [Bryobacteraceae bacterium]
MQLLRRALPLIAVAMLAAVAYDLWIFYSRWHSAREGERARQAEQARRDRETIEMLGGTDFRIINFYAVPQTIKQGSHARLCFGVYGAKRVSIEPEVGDLHPAVTDCLDVAPQKDTEYKLTAEDGAGHTVRASLSIKVVR